MEPAPVARTHQRVRCTAKSKQSGQRCKNWAINGGTVCRKHGGGAPQVKDKAKERVVMDRIGQELARRDIPAVDPLEALLREVGRSFIVVEALADMLDRLKDPNEQLATEVKVMTDTEDGFVFSWVDALWGPNHAGDLAPHVVYNMWERARAAHAKVCKMAIDAGVSERQVRIAEAQGELLAKVVTAMLDDPEWKLSQAQREKGRKVAGKHLRAVS